MRKKSNVVVIFSAENDYSTNEIMKWLFHFKKEVVRINKEESFDLTTLEYDAKNFIRIDSKNLNLLQEVVGVLFRRGYINLSYDFSISVNRNNKQGVNELIHYLNQEKTFLKDAVYYSMKKTLNILGNPNVYQNNRIITQCLASEIGFDIPPFIVTTEKKDLENFVTIHKKVVVKGVQEGITLHDGESYYSDRTTILEKCDLIKFSANFGFTHFQKYIEKEYEVRTFLLKDKFYSMAIFSQSRELTKVDYRNYDDEWPTKTVPYKLPIHIEVKLEKLFSSLYLDNGSVDLIKSIDGKYYFLEINPVGQYDNVSKLCNYYLDKQIAKILINEKSETD